MKQKRAQTEVITTVLLILVGIAAVVILSAFVVNLVKDNLKGTDCFQVVGQMTVKTDSSYFNSTSNAIVVVIERGSKDFNLTGISLVVGNSDQTKKIRIVAGNNIQNYILNSSFNPFVGNVTLPQSGESSIYRINVSSFNFNSINRVSVSPIINNNLECDKSDEQQIMIIQ